MAASIYDTLASPSAFDPYGLSGGMQRRQSYLAPNGQVVGTWLASDPRVPDAPRPAPYDPATDPNNPDNPNNTRSDFQRGITAGVRSLQGDVAAAKGLARMASGAQDMAQLAGHTPDQANPDLAIARQRFAEAQALGPRVSSLGDIRSAGDVGSYLAGAAGGLVPQAPLFLLGGGIGGGVAKGVAGGMLRRAVTGGLEDYAQGAAERALASGALKVAPEVAEAQGADAAAQAAKDQFAENLQQRALDRLAPQIAAKQAAAKSAGSLAGQLAANYPTGVGQVYQATMDDPAAQNDPHYAAKVLTGGALADLATVLPFHALGDAAGSAIAKDAEQKYLPRVIGATLKHGNAFGLGNAGATAAAIATHKWVDNNYDALTPQNFQQLLGSYANGAVLGGLLGGGKEAVSGVRLPEFNAKHLDWLRSLGNRFQTPDTPLGGESPTPPPAGGAGGAAEPPDAFSQAGVDRAAATAEQDALRYNTGGGPPPSPPPAGGAAVHPDAVNMLQGLYSKITDPATREALKSSFVQHYGDLKDAFQQGKDALGPLASRVFRSTVDAAPTPEAKSEATNAFADTLGDMADKSAGDAFAQHLDDVTGEGAGAADRDITPPNQRPQNNPVKLDDPLENMLASYIPHDHPLWAFPETIKPLAQSAAKLFRDETLTPQDEKNLQVMDQLVGKNNVDQWRQAGPAYAALSKAADALEKEEPASDTAMADAYRQALDAQKAAAPESDEPGSPATPNEAPVGLTEGAAPPTSTLAQQLDQTPLGTPKHAALQAQLRDQIDQRGALVTENQSSPKSKAFWQSKDPTQHANTIEVEPKQIGTTADGQPVMRRQALQLDNLVSAKLKEPDSVGNTTPKAALFDVLGDIVAAGHKIDPKSITPGVFYRSAEGADYRLSKRDVLGIRYGLRDPSVDSRTGAQAYATLRERLNVKPDKRLFGRQPVPANAESIYGNKQNTRELEVSAQRPAASKWIGTTATGDPYESGVRTNTVDHQEASDILPRSEIEGYDELAGYGNDQQKGAPSIGVLHQVGAAREPYRQLLRDARHASDAAATPRERAAIKHAAGIKIGEQELANELHPKTGEPTMSQGRYDRELARLHDYSSGLSRKYLYDAAQGKFDRAGVSQGRPIDAPLPADAATNAEEGSADKAINEGMQSAAQPSGPHDHVKETAMANALLEGMGVKGGKVTVEPLKAGDTAGGRHVASTGTLRINDNLHGAERIEVIAHELGHHVFSQELADAAGLTRAHVMKLGADDILGSRGVNGKRAGGLLEKAGKTDLRDALAGDYDKWLEGAKDPNAKVKDVMESRKPFHRGAALYGRSTEETVGELQARDPANLAYLHSFHEWVADNIARSLTQAERPTSIIGKFFGGIADKLRTLYQRMFGKPGAERYAPAPSVDQWVRSLFDRTNAETSEALGRATAKAESQAAIEAAVHEALKSPADRAIEASTRFFNYQLSPVERRALARLTDRPGIQRQITARYGHNEELMRRLEAPETAEATHAFLAYNMWRRGELNVGFHPLSIMQSVQNALMRVLGIATNNDTALRVFEDIKNGEIARLNKPGETPQYDLRQRLVDNDARNQTMQKAFNQAAKIGRQYVYEPWRKYAFGLGENIDKAMVPALSGLAAQIKRHTGESGNDPGMLPSVVRNRQQFHAAARKISRALTNDEKTAVHEAMQRRTNASDIADPKIRAAVTAQRALLGSIRTYMRAAGVPVGEIDKYYPIVMDSAAIRKDPQALTDLLSQPHFEKGIREYFSDRQGKPSQEKIGDLVQKMVRYASGTATDADTPDTGTARIASEKRRLMHFVYRDGTPADVEKFAAMQHKDPGVVLSRYIDSAVRRAESVRRFGVNGEKIDEAFEEAKRQHARPQDIEEMKNYLAAAHGRYAINGSPAIRKVFAKLGKADLGDKVNAKLFGPKGEGVQDMILAYQNARVLPLALLSSIVDPLGIGVRYGGWKSLGDLRAHWTAFKDGLVAASGGPSMQHLRDLGDAVKMADDYIVSDDLSNGYGGEGMGGLARKMSDAMFKYNGMNWYTRATRYMALSIGQHFLLKHAEGAEPGPNGSARYLRELGVQASDVKRDPLGGVKLLSEDELAKATPEARAADDRVRTALNRFVDESILRSDVSQHPLWMNDPAFRLISQYKAFQYAFGDQILGRLHHELQYSNLHVLGPALAYLPVTLAAETLRGFAQYGPGGNPHHKDWTPAEELAFLNQRSGILGPRFTQLAKGYAGEGSSYADMLDLPAGPSVSQAHEVLRTAEGKQSFKRTAVDALPASTLYHNWSSP